VGALPVADRRRIDQAGAWLEGGGDGWDTTNGYSW
jgi:hypothetical protein